MREDLFNGTAILLFVVLVAWMVKESPIRFAARRCELSHVNSCINNLRQLDGAAEQWRLGNNRDSAELPALTQVSAYIKGGVPTCPASGVYRFNTTNGLPTCSVPGHALP